MILATPASSAGLSTTVGLAQGWFLVTGEGERKMAVNGFNNLGLFNGMEIQGKMGPGPIPYQLLVDQINETLEKE